MTEFQVITTSSSGIITTTNIPSPNIQVITTSQVVGPQGLRGPSGPPGAGPKYYELSFGDASPVQVIEVEPGKILYSIGVLVEIPFNSPARIELKDSSETLLDDSSCTVVEEGTFVVYPTKKYTNADAITLTIYPGISTVGKCLIVYEVI